jgi:uncharacterized protein
MALSRRTFLRHCTVGAGVVVVGDLGAVLGCSAPRSVSTPAPDAPRHAPAAAVELVVDPAGILDLPPGFSYRVVSEAGEALPAGGRVPDRFDGTGCFAGPDGQVRLVRNHEQGRSGSPSTIQATTDRALVYDPGAHGGTTTVALDGGGRKIDERISLAGTDRNCAGGVTPWGTWLTCEESEVRAGGRYLKDHGFVFEVDPLDDANNRYPQPLTALGRFSHEAACIDPDSGTVYLTEDATDPNGLVYRCEPRDPTPRYGSLRAGGVLSAMVCTDAGEVVPDLSVYREPGTELAVGWVAVPDPLAARVPTRRQFAHPGSRTAVPATRSRKLEGMWWSAGRASIVCSYARRGDGEGEARLLHVHVQRLAPG